MTKKVLFWGYIILFIIFISLGAVMVSAVSTLLNIVGLIIIGGGFYFFISALHIFNKYLKELKDNSN